MEVDGGLGTLRNKSIDASGKAPVLVSVVPRINKAVKDKSGDKTGDSGVWRWGDGRMRIWDKARLLAWSLFPSCKAAKKKGGGGLREYETVEAVKRGKSGQQTR